MTIKTGTVEYHDDDLTFEAFYALPQSDKQQSFPIIMICHTGYGRDQFVQDKAEELANMGYLGVALDVYGKDVLVEDLDSVMAQVTPLLENRALLRQRLLCGIEMVKKLPQADSSRMAAIGYCLGGLCVLDMARAGYDLKGVASFHGLLTAPDNIPNADNISAKVLVLHGHDDPLAPPEQVLAFETEMTTAAVDWQIHIYGHTQHAFAHPAANNKSAWNIYNPQADKRSWAAFKNFLEEIF